ncbi:MAG: rRNA maturation RNase YbeY [Acidiferrobacteraceae bacterium]|nr:rRNA maturation RNase YbeY [Acidiferrobacteraceae bacterium]|tara:strand:+ start:423 stop:872 length:450 start_codon:yes stop_codon:yes gene_type:complete
MIELVDIQVSDDVTDLPDTQRIKKWVTEVFSVLNRSPITVTIRIVGEGEMLSLNRRYRGKDHPTNVLSFPFEPIPNICTDLLGDIVICAPVVKREALAEKKLISDHWAHMIFHGMLHLCGYHHDDDEEAIEMEALEKKLLSKFGVANLL